MSISVGDKKACRYRFPPVESLEKPNRVLNLCFPDVIFGHPYYGKTITARFETPTAFTPAMIRCAHEGLARIFKSGECYTRAGVLCTDLQPENAVQTGLFWDPNTKRNRVLLKVADDLMARWGRRKIRWASEGRNPIWSMRRAHLSKRYTTRWNDILEIEL